MIFESFGATLSLIDTLFQNWYGAFAVASLLILTLAAPDAEEFLFISASLLDQVSGFSQRRTVIS